MMKFVYPIAYDIKAEETESGNWRLLYMERFRSGHSQEIKNAVELIKSLLPDADIQLFEDRVVIELESTQDTVFNILTGEFLCVSALGKISFSELLLRLMAPNGKDERPPPPQIPPEQIHQLLEIGLRPVGVPNELSGDIVAAYLLIPTRGSAWWQIDDPKWEGSYIPLIAYKRGNACILVNYGKEDLWQRELADKLTEILGINVTARGD